MVKLMDCTLRDGANVVGKGFDANITKIVLDILTESHVPIIEFGNAGGIGAYEVAGFTNALTDREYLDLVKPYLGKAEIGMFLNAKRFREPYIEMAAANGMNFLRCGADAGDAKIAETPVKTIKKNGMKAYYSAMKAYLLSPEELAEEARFLESIGLDEFTIMDSAGTMLPDDVKRATECCKKAVKIPVAFHCHNNLGLSAANALAAYQSGADILDCGLMGMARSAGNLPTEAAVAFMQKYGEFTDIDLYTMLNGIDSRLKINTAVGRLPEDRDDGGGTAVNVCVEGAEFGGKTLVGGSDACRSKRVLRFGWDCLHGKSSDERYC